MATKTFTLAEIMNLHKEQYPNIMLSYFMDNHCNKLLEDTPGLKKVVVIVSDSVKYEYLKKKLEIV